MSILGVAPVCLRAVERARHDLQRGDWSLDSIAADLGAEHRWVAVPERFCGLVVGDGRRAVLTIADDLEGTEQGTVTRARMLAEVIAARASDAPYPHARVILRAAWRSDIRRRPSWDAGLLLAVSLGDVSAMVAGAATPGEIGKLRGVPAWIAGNRIIQEAAYGTIEGDSYAALAQMVAMGDAYLDWLDCRRTVA